MCNLKNTADSEDMAKQRDVCNTELCQHVMDKMNERSRGGSFKDGT